MSSNYEVVIFEDDPKRSETVQEVFEDTIEGYDAQIDITPFENSQGGSSSTLSAVKNEISSPDPALLVMLDWDLTGSTDAVQKEHVREACDEEDIPLLIYHQPERSIKETEKFEEYDTNDIRFDSGKSVDEVGRDGAGIAVGFEKIRSRTAEVYTDHKGTTSSSRTPMMYQILEAPESAAGDLENYNWGTPKDILLDTEEGNETKVESRIRQWSTHIGYWIWNEFLTFPGVLLNPTATAAYLNVDHEAFQADLQYLDELEDARYRGPFWQLNHWFWAPELDLIRAEMMNENDSQLPDGPEIFRRLDLPEIDQSRCQDEEHGGHPGARFYGAMMEAPVCKEHSERPDGLIPPGATRTRISTTQYQKYMPWMQ